MQEGWQPSTFTSSRSERSQQKQQRVEDFLDEDELEERSKTSLQLKVMGLHVGVYSSSMHRSLEAACCWQASFVSMRWL